MILVYRHSSSRQALGVLIDGTLIGEVAFASSEGLVLRHTGRSPVYIPYAVFSLLHCGLYGELT